MKRGTNKPWTDTRGRHLHVDKIKESSKTWSLNDWENYADSLDHGTEGILMTGRCLRKVANESSVNIFDLYAQLSCDEPTYQFVQEFLDILTPRQAHVVDLVYFQGRSLEETASIIGLGKTTVYDHLQRALNRLTAANAGRANELIVLREAFLSQQEPLSQEEEILEVMREEINRHGIRSRSFAQEA